MGTSSRVYSLKQELKGNAYPGRGIVLGITPDAKNAALAYFIMGRSVNSRNRVFVPDGEGLRTKAYDETKLQDPSLIIYSPVRVLDEVTIVTNGDQTDTVYEGLKKGLTFEQSLRSRTFEPDAPNYTPRISGIVRVADGRCFIAMSILTSDGGCPDRCNRYTYTFGNPAPGTGRFLHTYMHDGDPLPSFEGEPKPVEVTENDIDAWTALLWDALNEENKVSLFVRYIHLAGGSSETRICNKLS